MRILIRAVCLVYWCDPFDIGITGKTAQYGVGNLAPRRRGTPRQRSTVIDVHMARVTDRCATGLLWAVARAGHIGRQRKAMARQHRRSRSSFVWTAPF